ncbi:REJ domain containing protein [Parasponia andersonii]|uniref:REJ domain containing protein n=1 Tax=Parasponia andersonii TaxID=3476 RepID=A0A2P5BW44_PARAD|nr:REJ domain containing protein [Parasponia andersonii]
MQSFREALEDCNSEIMGFSGPKLTWDNRQEGIHDIQERLDRFTASSSRLSLFANARLLNLDFWGQTTGSSNSSWTPKIGMTMDVDGPNASFVSRLTGLGRKSASK